MNTLLNDLLLLLGGFIIIFLSKIIIPKESYEWKISLIIAIGIGSYFAFDFISTINFISLIPFILCGIFVYKGGRELELKTAALVFNNLYKREVGHVGSGTRWVDPFFEYISVSADGIPNKTVDLQELEIEIHETKLMQTKTRGIQAKINGISFMLKLHGDAKRLLDIEGGGKTIKTRLTKFVSEFFLKKVSRLNPEDIDQNKEEVIKMLCKELKKEVNSFCKTNDYPYEVVEETVIEDTELEPKYYEVLARKEFAKLEQDAQDLEAERLRDRVRKMGKKLLPKASEAEQIKRALITLKITPETIDKKIIDVSPEVATVLGEFARLISVRKK